MSTISSFKSIENKHDVYRGKDCMKTFFESFKEHPMEIINFKKKTKLLTNEQQKSCKSAKICKTRFIQFKYVKHKKYCKVRNHCHYTGEYRGATKSICNLKYNVPKEIPIVIYNGSNYDYHLIIKKLAQGLEKQFSCLGENTENYITFSVPIQK